MVSSSTIKVHFGEPQHGWLPVEFAAESIALSIGVSKVPSDPLAGLCEALRKVLKGLESEVFWHLEPGGYLMAFSPASTGRFTFALYQCEGYHPPAKKSTLLLSLCGNTNEIIAPFWRALRKFQTQVHAPGHWKELDPLKMDELAQLLEAAKRSRS